MTGAEPPRADASRDTHEVVLGSLAAGDGRRVLDAPCGQGALSLRLAEMGWEVWVLDCAPNVLRVEGLHFQVGDLGERLPYDDSFSDAVACVDGIEHLENPFHLIRECRRVLRPGGQLLLSTPNISSIRSRWRFLLSGFHNKSKRPLDEAHPSPSHHITPITYPWLRYRLHTNGFQVTRVTANRTKLASWPYVVLYAPCALYTIASSLRESDAEQRRRDWRILRTLFSLAVFLGETLIATAEKSV